MLRNKYLPATVLLLALLLISCSRPPQDSASGDAKQAPSPAGAKSPGGQSGKSSPKAAASPAPSPAADATEWSLTTAVVNILDKAHHTGSIVERGQCGSRNIVQVYSFRTPVTLEPMAAALNEISQRYPDLQWREAGEGRVRVTDGSARAGLLKVRVKEFLVIEDRPPQAALAALWKTEEVAAYMAKRHVRFARQTSSRSVAPRKQRPTVVHMKNATVQEIMDRIVDSYRAPAGSGLHKVWVYRECQSGAETVVEVRVQ
ncbi:MAG: hypothetical protein LAO20_09745 [Acidobacteriia bacterium]|nr:hypothetical protein [Terriglobia bacterium]